MTLAAQVAPYARPDPRRALWQLANTLLPFAALWYLMWRVQGQAYWATLLLALPAAGLLVRVFIIQHDCGHGSFLPGARANRITGRLCSLLTLTPYEYWRRHHAAHHATSSDLGRRAGFDIVTLTRREYQALKAHERWLYRVARHPLVLFGLLPSVYFVAVLRWPLLARPSWRAARRSILATDIALGALAAGCCLALGPRTWLAVQAPITLLAASAGFWLFYVQHQFEHTYWAPSERWSFEQAALQGSSLYDLPGVLRWFTGNIGFHPVHHLNPRIPNYRLKTCFDEVAGLQAVPRVSLRDGFRCARLRVWDEERARLLPL